VGFIFVFAENAIEGRFTAVMLVGLKVTNDFIERPKSDTEKKKKESNSTGKLKDDDDGNFGKKDKREKITSIVQSENIQKAAHLHLHLHLQRLLLTLTTLTIMH
jgi:hypothetical protein